MPLKQGDGAKSIGSNIKKEMAAGRSKKQAVAIALNVASDVKKAAHGGKKMAVKRGKC